MVGEREISLFWVKGGTRRPRKIFNVNRREIKNTFVPVYSDSSISSAIIKLRTLQNFIRNSCHKVNHFEVILHLIRFKLRWFSQISKSPRIPSCIVHMTTTPLYRYRKYWDILEAFVNRWGNNRNNKGNQKQIEDRARRRFK